MKKPEQKAGQGHRLCAKLRHIHEATGAVLLLPALFLPETRPIPRSWGDPSQDPTRVRPNQNKPVKNSDLRWLQTSAHSVPRTWSSSIAVAVPAALAVLVVPTVLVVVAVIVVWLFCFVFFCLVCFLIDYLIKFMN